MQASLIPLCQCDQVLFFSLSGCLANSSAETERKNSFSDFRNVDINPLRLQRPLKRSHRPLESHDVATVNLGKFHTNDLVVKMPAFQYKYCIESLSLLFFPFILIVYIKLTSYAAIPKKKKEDLML